MATAGTDVSLTTTPATVTVDPPATAIYIKNQSSSSDKVLVTIAGVCTDAAVEAGDLQPFRCGTAAIKSFSWKAKSSTATANWATFVSL